VLETLKPEHVLVPSLTIPRAVYVDVDKETADISLDVGEVLTLSKLYILNSLRTMPQTPKSDQDKYVINGLFANEDFESFSKVTLVSKMPSNRSALDHVIIAQCSNQSVLVTKQNLNVMKHLLFQGVLNR
jgi:hypothetical protein